MTRNIRFDAAGRNGLFYTVFAALLLLHLWLMWHTRIYPFVDLPNHLAKATIYRHYGDPSTRFAEYFRIDAFPKPNVFHLLFTGSHLFPSVESANRLLMCLYVVLLPLAVLLILRKMRSALWPVLLSFLCIYNLNMCWGFADFAIALPALLFWFYFLIDRHRRGDIRNGAMLSVLLLLLFFMHAIAALFSLMVFWVYCLYRYRASVRRLLAESLISLPLVAMLIAWWHIEPKEGPGVVPFLTGYYAAEYAPSILGRGRHLLTFDNMFLFDGPVGNGVSTLFSASIVILFISTALRARRTLAESIRNSALPWILLACAAFCFLALPPRIPGNVILYERFSVLVLISMIILIGILYPAKPSRAVTAAMCILSLAYSVLWADYFLEFQKENESFTKDFMAAAAGGTLVGLIYDAHYRGQPVYVHFPGYTIVWNRAIAATGVIDYRYGSVRRAADFESLPRYDEWIGAENRTWWDEYAVFDYVLVRGDMPEAADGPLREYTMIRRADGWSLYRKPLAQRKGP